ncbi:MAG: hypothetical protein ACRDRU_23010 [Pseudonocardiaceae bacterium]
MDTSLEPTADSTTNNAPDGNDNTALAATKSNTNGNEPTSFVSAETKTSEKTDISKEDNSGTRNDTNDAEKAANKEKDSPLTVSADEQDELSTPRSDTETIQTDISLPSAVAGPSSGDGNQHLQRNAGDKPRSWSPGRCDAKFEYSENGKLKVAEQNLNLVTQKYGIEIQSGARVMIQKGKRGIYGETSPGCGGPRIQITPEVFVNEEQVARTLYHENVHARQIIENGGRSHQTVGGRQRWEEEAYTAEDVLLDNHPINSEQR